MSNVDVVRVHILSALLEGFRQVKGRFEDIFLIIHCWIVWALVVVGDSGVFRKVHLGFGNVRLVNFAAITALVRYFSLLYSLRNRLYQPHFYLA